MQKTLREMVVPKGVSSEEDLPESTEKASNGIPVTKSPRKQPGTNETHREDQCRTRRTNSALLQGHEENPVVNGSLSHLEQSSSTVVAPESKAPDDGPVSRSIKVKTSPKKMLRLSANGKFSSPVSSQTKDEGRSRKSKGGSPPTILLAKMPYEIDSASGGKIDRILEGLERFKPSPKLLAKKQRAPGTSDPSRPSHPFFGAPGKSNGHSTKPTPQDAPPRASTSTPGKLKRHFTRQDLHLAPQAGDDVWSSALLKDRLMFKHPGAKEAPWPTSLEYHVRGIAVEHETNSGSPSPNLSLLRDCSSPPRSGTLPCPKRCFAGFPSGCCGT